VNSGLVFVEDLKLIARKIGYRVGQVKKDRKAILDSTPPSITTAAALSVDQSTNVCCAAVSCEPSCEDVSCEPRGETGYATLSDTQPTSLNMPGDADNTGLLQN